MPSTRSLPRHRLIGCLAALGLAACAVGPDYKGPPAAAIPAGGFKRALAGTEAGAPAARWWTALGDSELDRLIEAALEANPTVQAAAARVREARANYAQQRAGLAPSTGSSALYLRTKNPLDTGGGDLNLYTLGFDASWELDLFGGTRRAIEAAGAAAEASDASLDDVRVSLSAEVADAYVQLRDAQRRLALTLRNADIDAHLLELMEIRRSGGTASDLDVERVSNQLDSTRATLGPLRAQLTAQLDRLAVLTAQAPGALDAELATATAVPSPPATVAVGDPAALLRRRPDVVAAERRLAQSTAVVGQNVAALFPKVSLLGFLGFGATSAGALFNGSSFTPVLAPMLQWTPLDFGRTRGRINQAKAARDEAEANYRAAVLGALEDAETSLAQYGEQRGTVADLARVQQSAEKVYALTEIRLRGGTAATIDVLDADTRRIQAELGYQQALAQLTRDYVALQKSLGLGWVEPGSNQPAGRTK